MNNKNEIVLFENQEVKLEVSFKDETVWLTQEQMSKLFNKDRSVITKHIEDLNFDEILSYLTHIIRGERFCDGMIASKIL